MGSSDVPLEPRRLDWLKEVHRVGDEWQPRFVADRRVAERKAADYERMGWEVEIYPHPDDVPRGEAPDDHDRCVLYTRRPEGDRGGEEGGLVDDDLL